MGCIDAVTSFLVYLGVRINGIIVLSLVSEMELPRMHE
jgi:hypothetical protein